MGGMVEDEVFAQSKDLFGLGTGEDGFNKMGPIDSGRPSTAPDIRPSR